MQITTPSVNRPQPSTVVGISALLSGSAYSLTQYLHISSDLAFLIVLIVFGGLCVAIPDNTERHPVEKLGII